MSKFENTRYRWATRRAANLAAEIARHERRGDFVAASILAKQFVEALEVLDQQHAYTHVVVGDHTPERRVDHE